MNNYLKSISRRCALVFLLFQALVLSHIPVQATTSSQYAEMATALVTIPFDIVAHHATLKNKDKNNAQSAALLHVTADTLTILNKILFLYNNINGQKEIHGGRWTSKSRDFLVNGAFLIRGLMKFDQHLKTFMQAHHSEDENFSFTDRADLVVRAGDAKEQEISKLAYAFEVVVLPSLKGLTAFALACTQDGATQYASRQARNLATATHSFVNLSQEYTALKPDSDYKKLMAAVLFVNAAWLVHELQKYISEPKIPVAPNAPKQPDAPMKKIKGNCILCTDDKKLEQLHCGHGYCKECLATVVNNRYRERRAALDQTPCPDCNTPMSRGEMAAITDNNKKILDAYDQASAGRKKPKKPAELDEESKKLMKASNARPCPGCSEVFERSEGCNHMKCICGHEFCYVCLADYPNYRHAAPDCRAGLYGAGADDNDDEGDDSDDDDDNDGLYRVQPLPEERGRAFMEREARWRREEHERFDRIMRDEPTARPGLFDLLWF